MKYVKEKLKELGWNVPENTECWEENGNLFFIIDPDDITGYTMEVDPETGRSRHIGNGRKPGNAERRMQWKNKEVDINKRKVKVNYVKDLFDKLRKIQ